MKKMDVGAEAPRAWLIGLRARPRPARLLAALGLLAATLTAQAASFSSTVLGALAPDSGSASFTTLSAPGTVMSVLETGSATMTGSDLFGFEGLWLGSDGTGGRYTFGFNVPVTSISFHVIALTDFGGGLQERLNTFVSSAATTSSFVSADGSATWNPGTLTLTPLLEDSRGVLTFASVAPAGFSSIRFDHFQPDQLQGFVIEQIDFTVTAVPEPASAGMLAIGLLGLRSLRRLRRQRHPSA